jgi:spore cortex formation protein SpoVR/YcgB (stage V sporulation)
VRSALADSYDVSANEPDIQVVDVDLLGERSLVLRHTLRNGVRLAEVDREATLRHIRRLWGHVVRLEETPIAP